MLPVDKPAGPTSHDVVDAARRALGERRIGHTGTLDPFASGLLLLCVGKATRLAEYLTGLPKAYEAVARLGVRTDTDDLQGAVLAETEAWRSVQESDVLRAMEALRGPTAQVPPQYSAKKVHGVAMHRRARRGETVRLEPVRIVVHALELTEFSAPDVRFRVRCSSGTYVRALARDLGESLGAGAHLTMLRRTAVGPFGVERALRLDELTDPERVAEAWIDPLAALTHLPVVEVAAADARALTNGRPVRVAEPSPQGPAAAAHEKALVAVCDVQGGFLRPRKVFVHD